VSAYYRSGEFWMCLLLTVVDLITLADLGGFLHRRGASLAAFGPALLIGAVAAVWSLAILVRARSRDFDPRLRPPAMVRVSVLWVTSLLIVLWSVLSSLR
jgi:hypothetical protein